MEKFEKLRNLNIKVPPTIISNQDLSLTEKLILALDYSFGFKNGYNILSNVAVGELLCIHKNIVGKYRKHLIESGYLEKDSEDKRKFILTDKLKNIEIPFEIGKDGRMIIIPFEVYSHPNLKVGAKLLWGEYNSMSKNEKGYFQKRETTANKFNVSEDSITNWTKELEQYGFLEEYTIKSGYHTKQKIVRTKDLRKNRKAVDDFEDDFENNSKDSSEKTVERKSDIKKEEFKMEPLGAIRKYSDLNINKEKYNYEDEEDDYDYYDEESFDDEE